MLPQSLLLAWRNLIRQKSYSAINLLGLAIGMAAAFLILQYVQFEWSFDRFHEKGEQLYRVINDRYQNGERVQIGTITYPVVGPEIQSAIPEIEAVRKKCRSNNVKSFIIASECYIPSLN